MFLLPYTYKALLAEMRRIDDFNGVGHFEAKFQVKGLRFALKYGPFIGKRLYYNSAAESILSKELCSRLHSIEVEFYSKKE